MFRITSLIREFASSVLFVYYWINVVQGGLGAGTGACKMEVLAVALAQVLAGWALGNTETKQLASTCASTPASTPILASTCASFPYQVGSQHMAGRPAHSEHIPRKSCRCPVLVQRCIDPVKTQLHAD